jgi:hypothetical protein
MTSSQNKTGFFKIVVRDYWAFLGVLATGGALFVGPFAPLVWLVSIPVLFHRYLMISKIVKKGKEAEGVIITIAYFKGHRVVYSYTVGDKTIQAKNVVMGIKLPIDIGQKVTICYDEKKPERGFVKELYVKNN